MIHTVTLVRRQRTEVLQQVNRALRINGHLDLRRYLQSLPLHAPGPHKSRSTRRPPHPSAPAPAPAHRLRRERVERLVDLHRRMRRRQRRSFRQRR